MDIQPILVSTIGILSAGDGVELADHPYSFWDGRSAGPRGLPTVEGANRTTVNGFTCKDCGHVFLRRSEADGHTCAVCA